MDKQKKDLIALVGTIIVAALLYVLFGPHTIAPPSENTNAAAAPASPPAPATAPATAPAPTPAVKKPVEPKDLPPREVISKLLALPTKPLALSEDDPFSPKMDSSKKVSSEAIVGDARPTVAKEKLPALPPATPGVVVPTTESRVSLTGILINEPSLAMFRVTDSKKGQRNIIARVGQPVLSEAGNKITLMVIDSDRVLLKTPTGKCPLVLGETYGGGGSNAQPAEANGTNPADRKPAVGNGGATGTGAKPNSAN